MAFCKKCGAEIKEGATFCSKCGATASNEGTTGSDNVKDEHSDGKLMRTDDGRVLAGICAGLGKKYNKNPWIFRGILIVTNFFVIGWFLDIAYVIGIFALKKEGE